VAQGHWEYCFLPLYWLARDKGEIEQFTFSLIFGNIGEAISVRVVQQGLRWFAGDHPDDDCRGSTRKCCNEQILSVD